MNLKKSVLLVKLINVLKWKKMIIFLNLNVFNIYQNVLNKKTLVNLLIMWKLLKTINVKKSKLKGNM